MVSTAVIHVITRITTHLRTRRDGRLSWLTHSRRLTYLSSVKHIRHRLGKVRKPKTNVLTTELGIVSTVLSLQSTQWRLRGFIQYNLSELLFTVLWVLWIRATQAEQGRFRAFERNSLERDRAGRLCPFLPTSRSDCEFACESQSCHLHIRQHIAAIKCQTPSKRRTNERTDVRLVVRCVCQGVHPMGQNEARCFTEI